MTSPHGSRPPCPKLLAAFFDGECEGRDDLAQLKQEIEAWLAVNPRAQQDLAEYRRLLQTWQNTSPLDPDPAQWSAMLARVEAETSMGLGISECKCEQPRTRARRSMVRWTAAATVAAACLAVVLLWQPAPRVPQVLPPAPTVARAAIDDEVLPVADGQEVVIVRVEGADTHTLVVGQLPVQGILELAAPGDVVVMRLRPDASDNMIPHMNESSAPLIWSKLDSELD